MKIGDEISLMLNQSMKALSGSLAIKSAISDQLKTIDLTTQITQIVDSRLSGSTLFSSELNDSQVKDVAAKIAYFMQNSSGITLLDNQTRSIIADLKYRMSILESGFSISSGSMLLHSAAITLSGATTVRGSFKIEGPMIIGNQFSILNSSASADATADRQFSILSVSGSLVEIGSLVSSGSLKVLGPITVSGIATFLGEVHMSGSLVLSNKQAGFAVIPVTGSSVTIRFDTPMVATPVVTATPDVPVLYGVSKVTATGFTIRIAAPANEKITFAYIALSADHPRTYMGTGSITSETLKPFPVDSLGRPFSLTDPVWTACIQGRQTLDPSGTPYSCSRYHDDYSWEHPDLHITFIWNPNHEPPVLTVPEGYEVVIVGGEGLGLELGTETGSTLQPQPEPQPEPEEVLGTETGSTL